METTENKNEKRHFCGNRKHRAGWILLAIAGVTVFAFLFGAIIMWLWNCLMPVIFHLAVITFWQAVGLAVLARLLFGNLHHGHRHHRGGPKFGPWKNRHHPDHCPDSSNSNKWRYYDQYWNEEGEQSFNDYLKRKTGNPVKE